VSFTVQAATDTAAATTSVHARNALSI
jgi:hypothetical protein